MAKNTHTATILVDSAGIARALSLPAYRLRVLKGADKGREKRSSSRHLLIGSGGGADFVLQDRTVSSIHCELIADEDGLRVKDLGAKNGVVIAGRRVLEAFLEEKDELQLGASVIRFQLLNEVDEQPLVKRKGFGKLLGSSARMRELYGILERAASSDAPVLITGETGSGKELAADSLVTEGPRKELPFVVVDCGRLPPTLAESELFGHEKGAFTGASERRIGALEQAGNGTVFLDEIGELPLELQPKLLGVLERKVFTRVGGGESIPFKARVVAATHRELEREVNKGGFRADLFYRLAVIQLRMPALREHAEDIPELVGHFLEDLPGAHLSATALQLIYRGDYPGNVRELRAAVERAVLGLQLPSAQMPATNKVDLEQPFRLQKERLIQSFEREYLVRILEACKGNVSEVARRSGLNRVHLYEMLGRYGLQPKR